jgi:hypothetical protein
MSVGGRNHDVLGGYTGISSDPLPRPAHRFLAHINYVAGKEQELRPPIVKEQAAAPQRIVYADTHPLYMGIAEQELAVFGGYIDLGGSCQKASVHWTGTSKYRLLTFAATFSIIPADRDVGIFEIII